MAQKWRVAGPYRTGDLGLAASLMTIGHDLVGINYAPSNNNRPLAKGRTHRTKLIFEFALSEGLNESIIAFTSRNLRVSASLLLDNFGHLKALVANSSYLSLKEIQHQVQPDTDAIEHGAS